MRKTILILAALMLTTATAIAQPSWVKKATKSVFTLKTFADDGQLIGSSQGFFVGTNGEAVSNFTPFKGASRAVVIDATGKEMSVLSILGANDMYDVVKFRVDAGKTQPLTLAPTVATVGSTAWLLPYRETKQVKSGPVRKAETFQTVYAYYTVAIKPSESTVSCPLLNDAGQVLGLIQQPATDADSLSYAVSASFVDSLKVSALSLNDPTMRMTRIKTEMPDRLSDANLMIYMAGSSLDSASYAMLVDDFISKFPTEPDGYVYRAQMRAGYGEFASADRDMQQAIGIAKEKDDPHFQLARLIYNKNIYQADIPYDSWTFDRALSEVREANAINPQPTYLQMEANILFAQKEYREAYDRYIALTKTALNGADTWYSASRCQAMLKDTTAMLALLDSAMNTFTKPYLKEAAPYLWVRANAKMDARQFRSAVNDLNDYEQLMSAQVNAQFYYIRHQAEVEGRLYQQALNDIDQAIRLNPAETLYYAEKASLQIRVGQYAEAVVTADECIAADPESSDGYLFKGLALCLSGNKKEGLKLLQKAKEMGDPQAEGLIAKYA